jgi:hypothetical protein
MMTTADATLKRGKCRTPNHCDLTYKSGTDSPLDKMKVGVFTELALFFSNKAMFYNMGGVASFTARHDKTLKQKG